MTTPLALLDDADRLRAALSPVRRRMLSALAEPASAASLAADLGLPRQQVGYHLKALEAAGLVELVEERRRRGFVERLFRASAGAFVVDPGVLGSPEAMTQDRYAADHLVATAAEVVREVGRMRGEAYAAGQRLLTFTLEAEVAFATPADLEVFGERLATAMAKLAREFDTPGGRPYRVLAGGHPALGSRKRSSGDGGRKLS